jgi:hypothetical protein
MTFIRELQAEFRNRSWTLWGLCSVSIALLLFLLPKFLIAAGALLAYLVLLLKISDGQAGSALEAECGKWR